LHIGHAYAAFRASDAAGPDGRFLLRIEDIDSTRCRPEFEQAILEDLAWLGLSWAQPVRRQSEHFADYRAALDRLRAEDLIYPCFCTRAEILREIAAAGAAPHGPEGPVYPGTCRHLSAEERAARSHLPYALRLRMDEACARTGPLTWIDEQRGAIDARPQMFGDIVLARKDTPASYHLACTHDDALQGVTVVTRGEDLFEATHIHRLLQALLALPTPRYRHHRLLTDTSGRKFSKRDQAPTLRTLREAGQTPADVRAMIEAATQEEPGSRDHA
jgi:glutamyl-Q tRNA(Asp) synthetase